MLTRRQQSAVSVIDFVAMSRNHGSMEQLRSKESCSRMACVCANLQERLQADRSELRLQEWEVADGSRRGLNRTDAWEAHAAHVKACRDLLRTPEHPVRSRAQPRVILLLHQSCIVARVIRMFLARSQDRSRGESLTKSFRKVSHGRQNNTLGL